MKIVITGSGGRLGATLLREYGGGAPGSGGIGFQPIRGLEPGLGSPSHDVVGFNHTQLDLGNFDDVRRTLESLEFDLLINAAAFTNVDLSEKERDRAFQINGEAPRVLAEICRNKNARLIHFSTDYVFDGEKREPYVESDPVRPISVYGESKRAGEENVLGVDDHNLVVRVSWVFGPDRPSFVDQMIARARENETIAAVADKWSTPTYTRDIAEMLLPFLNGRDAALRRPGAPGILHLANAGDCSWQEYAQFALDCCRSAGIQLKAATVGSIKLSDMKNWVARRPVYSVLSTEKFFLLTGTTPRNWRDAVGEYVREIVARRAADTPA
jgi:dTDP-4-dehydrorhamnose reductase